jgi:ribonuclease Z
MPIHLITIEPGIIFTAEDFTIRAFPVYHRSPDCFGFLFEEKSRRPFLPEKAQELSIPPGPWRRDLVEGKSVTLPDGRVIDPDMVLGEERRGTRLAFIGDVGHTDSLVEIIRDVDGLVIESTYLEEERQMAQQFAHLTARQAAELAKKAGVKTLYLTHLSRRYRDRDVMQEAQAHFPGAVVARDFDVFTIKREE